MRKIVDLSYTIQLNHWRPVWRAGLEVLQDFDRTGHDWHHSLITIDPHAFTHIDGSLHFIDGGQTVNDIPMEKLIGTGVIVDLSHLGPNEPVTAELLDRHGSFIKEGDMVLIKTLWDEKCSHTTKEFWTEAPYTEADACHWLVDRKVKAVGYDYPPDYCIRYKYLDPPKTYKKEEAVTHNIILRENILIIEYLTNLGKLRHNIFDLYVLPIKLEGVEGMPTRVVAIEND